MPWKRWSQTRGKFLGMGLCMLRIALGEFLELFVRCKRLRTLTVAILLAQEGEDTSCIVIPSWDGFDKVVTV